MPAGLLGIEDLSREAIEAFLNRAKSGLADIKRRLGTVGNLDCYVSSFEISPQEVAANS